MIENCNLDEFLVLDLETTGTDPQKNEIIDIGIIHFKNGQIDKFSTLIRPEIMPDKFIENLTGIYAKDLANEEGLPKLQSLISSKIPPHIPIVGHNISFDIGFLREKGFLIDNPEIDTLIFSRFLFPEFDNFGLESMSSHLNLSHNQAHRALSDAEANLILFLKIIEKINDLPQEFIKKITPIIKKSPPEIKPLFPKEGKDAPCLDNFSLKIQKDSKLSEKTSSLMERDGKMVIQVSDSLKARHSLLEYIAKIETESVALVLSDSRKAHQTALTSLEFAPYFPEIVDQADNYLSLEKYRLFKKRKSFSVEEALLAMKIEMGFLRSEKDLHIENFKIRSREKEIWKYLSASESDQVREKTNFKIVTLDAFLSLPAEEMPERILFEDPEILFLNTASSFKKEINLPGIERILSLSQEVVSRKETALLKAIHRNLAFLWGRIGILAEKISDSSQIYSQNIVITSVVRNLSDFKKVLSTSEIFIGSLEKLFELLPNFLVKEAQKEIDKLKFFLEGKAELSWIHMRSNGFFNLCFSNEMEGDSLKKHFQHKKLLLYGESVNQEFCNFFAENFQTEVDFFPLSSPKEIKTNFVSLAEKEKGDFLVKNLREEKGNTLLIFSSKRDLDKFYLLHHRKLNLLMHQKKSAQEIIEKEEKFILLGTFRSHLPRDLQEKFSRIIIFKIPFEMPRSPLEEKKSQSVKNAFINWTLPRTALRLRSALEPFLNSQNLREILFLDDRIFTKDYGKDFLEFFPELRV